MNDNCNYHGQGHGMCAMVMDIHTMIFQSKHNWNVPVDLEIDDRLMIDDHPAMSLTMPGRDPAIPIFQSIVPSIFPPIFPQSHQKSPGTPMRGDHFAGCHLLQPMGKHGKTHINHKSLSKIITNKKRLDKNSGGITILYGSSTDLSDLPPFGIKRAMISTRPSRFPSECLTSRMVAPQ